MVEDKLATDQRIRLEAIAQANLLLAAANRTWSDTGRTLALLRCADRIAKYVSGEPVSELLRLTDGGGDDAA